MIVDRLGSPLAISSPLDSIWINPQLFKSSGKQRFLLAKYLGINGFNMRKRVQRAQKIGREFMYLKRLNTPKVATEVKQLKI